MTIEYSKIVDRGPSSVARQLFINRLGDIEYYTDSIFIVVSIDSLVSVGSICFDESIVFERTFGGFMVW